MHTSSGSPPPPHLHGGFPFGDLVGLLVGRHPHVHSPHARHVLVAYMGEKRKYIGEKKKEAMGWVGVKIPGIQPIRIENGMQKNANCCAEQRARINLLRAVPNERKQSLFVTIYINIRFETFVNCPYILCLSLIHI